MTAPSSSLIVPDWLRVIALYGSIAYLQDLNDIMGSGRRIPGGFTIPIQMAAMKQDVILQSVLELADSDPDYARDLAAMFSRSRQLAIRQFGSRLQGRLTSVENAGMNPDPETSPDQ